MDPRERILQKAHDLFNRYGIRSVTMDEIATQIGMSKKTIYQSFANKDELVDAVIEEYISTNKGRCEQDKSVAENAIHHIFLTMDMVQEMLGDINPTIFNDLQRFHPLTFTKLNHFKDLFLYSEVSSNIKRGIEEGMYRDDMNIDVITKLRLSTMFLPFNQDVFPHHKYNFVDVEIETLEHFLYGLSTTKAHKLIVKYKQERLKNQLAK
jgi:AcrR family transcriptional regulator